MRRRLRIRQNQSQQATIPAATAREQAWSWGTLGTCSVGTERALTSTHYTMDSNYLLATAFEFTTPSFPASPTDTASRLPRHRANHHARRRETSSSRRRVPAAPARLRL